MRTPARAALVALVLALSSAAAHAQAAPKIGYVDVATVMEQVPGRAEAQQGFEREATGIRAELQRMNDSLQTMVGGYQRQQATLTAAQRQAREREIQTKQQEYAQRAQALQERGARREQELVGQFETAVRAAIDEVRTAGGYAMIFAAGQNSAMLSADRALDVTAQVSTRLRARGPVRPAAAGTAPAAAAPAAGAPAAAAPGGPVAAPAGAVRRPPSQR